MSSAPIRSTWTTVLCDSLEKVFPDLAPRPFNSAIPLVALQGESVAVQVAFLPPTVAEATGLGKVGVEVSGPEAVSVVLRSVDLVPVELAAFENADEHYLRTGPGLFPDLLTPAADEMVRPAAGQWRAAWVDLVIPDDFDAGQHEFTITLTSTATGARIGAHRVTIHTVAEQMPDLEIVNTHWFHCDGLANFYGYDVFGENHWKTIDAFLGSAARMRVNSVLTPTWTPPLDTAVGGTRTPTQLIGIRDVGSDRYEFDFTKLRRWLELCRKHGIRSIEVAHFFTQWGARATPAIYVLKDGVLEQRFGWHLAATAPSYRSFLEQLVPQLRALLDREWGLENVIFHVSDEPTLEHRESYSAAREVVADLLSGCTVVDAISDFGLYEDGLVPIPVIASDHAAPFLEAGVDPLWLYYCVAQDRDVANRFMSMPSARNRVLGTQLFLTGAKGFLHWGFNFYNSFHSTRAINPFQDTCAGGGFPGGDAFMVYPGPEGEPLESIRFQVFVEAMDDLRLMELLRQRAGDDAVRVIVDPEGRITLDQFPYDPDHYRRVRATLVDAVVGAGLPRR